MVVQWIKKAEVSSVVALISALEKTSADIVGIATDEVIQTLTEKDLDRWYSDADVVHAGLSFGSGIAFEAVQVCTFNWHFLNPSSDVPAVSWKATLDFVLFDRRLLGSVGAFDARYLNPDAALMDWAYRALLRGAKVMNYPLPQITRDVGNLVVPCEDEMLFVNKHFNLSAQRFFKFTQFCLSGRWLSSRGAISEPTGKLLDHGLFKLTSKGKQTKVGSYAALVPTIDRYDYIGASISSLAKLSNPPEKIVVVDQTPLAMRRPEVYEPFVNQGLVQVIYLEKAGQSTARNVGLNAIQQEWVLLFEDDAEAWPDMVAEHMSLIENSGCDVSTGVIVPPGYDRNFIDERNRRFALSEILTTGNAFMRVETALSVSGFDPAFDHGPGADDDFGKRLYRSGKIIIYNFKSIETHYKAPRGGMRVHGVWWRNKSTWLGPYPPVTQSFMIRKYYSSRYRFFLFLSIILKARKKYSTISYVLFLFLLPYKLAVSLKRASSLINRD